MDLSSALQWWEEWQLRILVLVSFFFHLFLYFSPWVRLVPTMRRFRVLVWIAYIGGDAVAIYALATLFNRHKQQQQTTSALEVVWAPILLIHLGGHTEISAYSLEDNELWRRHAITLVSQITVALYVFCKWWSGEIKRILQSAVLLFIVGIFKFSEKPWALRRASFSSMLASTGVSSRRKQRSGGPLRSLACCLDMLGELGRGGGGGEEEGSNISLEEYVQKAKTYVHDTVVVAGYEDVAFDHAKGISMMFVDLPAPYSARLSKLHSFLKLDEKHAHKAVQSCLMYTFMLLYTRISTVVSLVGLLRILVLPFLPIASLVLFAKSHKGDYNENDVWVTYILICCTAAIDFLPCLLKPCLKCSNKAPDSSHCMVSQCSLMAMCVRKKQPTLVMKLATFNCLRDYVDKYWYVWQEPVELQITRLVHQHLKEGWKDYIHNAAKYRRFSELRGQQSLRRHRQLLGWSLKMPFDESVLLWHITTDLCFHHLNPDSTTTLVPPQPQGGQEEITDSAAIEETADPTGCSRAISNYMIYLLFIHPEMLMPGTRQGLFSIAGDDIEFILKDCKAQLDNEQTLVREIIDTVNSSATGTPVVHITQESGRHTNEDVEAPATAATATGTACTPTPIHHACRLAKALMELDDKERWAVIQGVWVEMLCYSASRCRGYLHAKSLGQGFEYLSIVWLLWWSMGMETLGDRCQMSEPLEEEARTSHSCINCPLPS